DPCGNRVTGVRIKRNSLKPTHPAKTWSVTARIVQTAIRNILRFQKYLYVEYHRLAGDVSRQFNQFRHRPAIGKKLFKSLQTYGPHANTKSRLLIPNLRSKKRAFTELVSFEFIG